MSDDHKVFELVESIDRKLDAKGKADEARFTTLDRKFDAKSDADEARLMALEAVGRNHEDRINDHDGRIVSLETGMRDQAALLVVHGQSTARAVDIALKAQQEASRSKEECVTIVESAIRMHSASITATVSAAVKAEITPIVGDVVKLKTSTAEQDVKLDTIAAGVKRIGSAIGHPHLRLLIVLCVALGSLGGAAYAAYEAVTATTISTKDHP